MKLRLLVGETENENWLNAVGFQKFTSKYFENALKL